MFTALLATSCNFAGDGPGAFKASQKAAMRVNHFTVELEQKTKMGVFRNTQLIDCGARSFADRYFYDHEVKDLSPEGIEAGVTQMQGRPNAHQESDALFVNGKSYGRNSSNWENPSLGTDDASPDWHPISMTRDPAEPCVDMKWGRGFGYVAYDKILKSGSIRYLGKQWINGHKCLEYQTSFPDRTSRDTKICLGAKDDLPYRVVDEDYAATYSYEDVVKLPAPVQTPPAAPQ